MLQLVIFDQRLNFKGELKMETKDIKNIAHKYFEKIYGYPPFVPPFNHEDWTDPWKEKPQNPYKDLWDEYIKKATESLKDQNNHNEKKVVNPYSDVESYQENDVQTIKIDVPGFKEDEIAISHEKNVLKVLASKDKHIENPNAIRKVLIKKDREVNKEWTFYTSENCDSDSMVAKLEDGILVITIKSKPVIKELPKKISIIKG